MTKELRVNTLSGDKTNTPWGVRYLKQQKQKRKCILTKAMNIQAGSSIRGLLAPTSWSVQDVKYAFIAPIENSRTMVASYPR